MWENKTKHETSNPGILPSVLKIQGWMPEDIGPSAERSWKYFCFKRDYVCYLKLTSNLSFLAVCLHQLKQKNLESFQIYLWKRELVCVLSGLHPNPLFSGLWEASWFIKACPIGGWGISILHLLRCRWALALLWWARGSNSGEWWQHRSLPGLPSPVQHNEQLHRAPKGFCCARSITRREKLCVLVW